MAAQSLHARSFQQVTFTPISRDNQVWLRVHQIGVALGYKRPDILNKLYAQHADEFTPAMTQLIELGTGGGKQTVRVFSLRGAHLLAMFARTTVAKDFRRWVLDVLERETAPAALPAPVAAKLPAVLPAGAVIHSEGMVRGLYHHAWQAFMVIVDLQLADRPQEAALLLAQWQAAYPPAITRGIEADVTLACQQSLQRTPR